MTSYYDAALWCYICVWKWPLFHQEEQPAFLIRYSKSITENPDFRKESTLFFKKIVIVCLSVSYFSILFCTQTVNRSSPRRRRFNTSCLLHYSAFYCYLPIMHWLCQLLMWHFQFCKTHSC